MKELEYKGLKLATNATEIEPKKTMAFLGPPGTFTEDVALKLAKANNAILVEAKSITQIFDLVEQGVVTYGTVPIQN